MIHIVEVKHDGGAATIHIAVDERQVERPLIVCGDEPVEGRGERLIEARAGLRTSAADVNYQWSDGELDETAERVVAIVELMYLKEE
ncbi:MAG: hypothetical protein WCW16_03190 [Candidatus Magasanikbacteria bacterium]